MAVRRHGGRQAAPPGLDSESPAPGRRRGLQTAVAAAGLAVILHEDAVRPLRQVLESWQAARPAGDGAGTDLDVLLIVGPEGGISPQEVTRLCDAGAVTALLGHHVLRSSTAGPAATVLASDVLGRW